MPERVAAENTGITGVEVARAALVEITPEANIGAFVSEETNDEGVSTIRFASSMLGYPDWFWTVSVATLPDEDPTVLEAELLPGDGALLAPDWIPWSDRLEDYKAAQAAIAAGELAESDDDESDEDSDDDDSDDDDDDDIDDHDDDDLGDDPDDGIDFESDEALAGVPAPVGDDEQDEPDAESDESSPEPPLTPVRNQRRKKKQ
ncbi:MAG TPA: DUF3027 domain-containing protein [Pseudolysinimonas sp.]|jgi:hypothetical protein